MNTHRILRQFSGCPAKVGEEVDASGWRTVRQLEAQRYIQPIPASQPQDGRKQGVEHSAAKPAPAKRGLE